MTLRSSSRVVKFVIAMAALLARQRDFIGQFRMDFGIIGISGIDMTGALLDF